MLSTLWRTHHLFKTEKKYHMRIGKGSIMTWRENWCYSSVIYHWFLASGKYFDTSRKKNWRLQTRLKTSGFCAREQNGHKIGNLPTPLEIEKNTIL